MDAIRSQTKTCSPDLVHETKPPQRCRRQLTVPTSIRLRSTILPSQQSNSSTSTMLETDFQPMGQPKTHCLRRSVHDYRNKQDVEAALRDNLRSSMLQSRSLRDVFWRVPQHEEVAVDDEVRRLESLKSFDLLHSYPSSIEAAKTRVPISLPSPGTALAELASAICPVPATATATISLSDDDFGTTAITPQHKPDS